MNVYEGLDDHDKFGVPLYIRHVLVRLGTTLWSYRKEFGGASARDTEIKDLSLRAAQRLIRDHFRHLQGNFHPCDLLYADRKILQVEQLTALDLELL